MAGVVQVALNNPYSISLDGVDDYIRIPSNGNFLNDPSLTGQLTVEFWARIESGYYIISSGASTSYRGISISYQDGNRIIHLADGAKLWTINEAHMILNEWHHYALVWDGTTLTWIVDGEQKNQVTGTANSRDSAYLYTDIGKQLNTTAFYCKFDLDELRVWDHARDLELIEHYKDQRLSPEKPGLAIYYSFDSDSGNIAYDLGPGAIDAMVYGATWISSEINLCLLNLDIVSDFRAKAHIGPKVETLPATDIGSKSMTLNGKLKGIANYAGAECGFEYYPVDQYQNKALNFNGEGHIRIPYESCLSPETITIEAFIEPSQLSGTQTILSQGYQEFDLSDYNTIIYVNAEKGNDLTGNGTQKFPFQTLTEAIKHHNGSTAFILGEGIYDSVNVNSAEYQEKLAFIGQGRDTTFKIKGTLTASGGSAVKLTADLYFYNLVWDGNNLGGTNYMHLGNYSSWRFYNVVFTDIEDCDYGYFLINQPGLVLSFENCIKTAPSKDFLRHSEDADVPGIIKNCYGAWSDWGYDTTESDFIITTTIMTDTPQLDTDYNILDEGWQNAGTGTNPDGTQAHIGVYGGHYAWDYLSYFLKLADSRVEFGCTTDSASRLFSQHEISEGETVHVACTYDKIGMKIYINGNLDSFMPKNGNLFAFSMPLYIAKNFNGTIDEIRIWNRARTQKEIEECIYQELTGAEEGLIAYYRFNEGEGDIIYDCSANYNDGTINNALWVDSPFELMPPKEKLERTKGLSFDGIDDYVQIPKEALVFNSSPRTYSIYFKADKTLQTSMHILAYGEGATGKAFGLQLGTTGILYLNLYGGGVNNIQLFQTNWEGWVDLVYDGTTLKVYYNGEKTFDQNININTGLSEYGHLGHRFYYDPHWYKGIISEFRSFNYALSELELAAYRYRQLSGNERGLLGYYKMSEEQDNVLIDYSDNNNHGTIYGATWKDEELKVLAPSSLQETPPQKIYSPYTLVKTVTSKEVNGLYFDGVDDYVSIPHNAIIKPQHITIMAWVDRDDWAQVDTNGARIISCTESGGYAISVHSDGRIMFALYIGGGYRYAYSSGPISPGLHFICATYDGKSLKLYIDGELDSEIPYSGNISYSVNNHVTIGVESGGAAGVESGFYLSGVISNLSIWNRGLSEEEVSYYYNNELKGNEHGLVAYYKMDEGESNKVYNSSLYKSEYNLDGTIYGATWDVISLPKIKYEYQPGVKFSSTVVPGEYIPVDVKGLSFDGVDDYVMVPYTSKLTPTRVSIMAAVIIDNWAAIDVGEIVSKQHTGGYVVYVGSSQGIGFRLYISGGYRDLYAPQNELSPGLHFLCCTYDGSYMRIYIDGELAAEMAQTGNIQYSYNNALMIGCDAGQSSSPDSSTWLKGKVGNISIWNRGLTEEEVKLLYNKELKGNEQGLVAYYKDVFHGKLIDATSNWLDGTIYGAIEVDNISVYSLDKEPSNIRYYYRAVAKGLPDYALSFDGENDHILLGTGVNLFNIVNEFTLFSLFALTNEEDVFYMFGLGYHSNPVTASYNSGIMLSVEPSNINIEVGQNYIRDSTTRTNCPINLNIGVPYHLVITRKQNILKIFIDSNLVYERNDLRPGDVYWDSRAFRIAAESNQISDDLRFFSPGTIYECGIFNRMLSNEEVKNLYTKKLVGNEPGLTGYYRIVEGEGNVLVDHSPNGKHGTIYGATWVQL